MKVQFYIPGAAPSESNEHVVDMPAPPRVDETVTMPDGTERIVRHVGWYPWGHPTTDADEPGDPFVYVVLR